MGDIHENIQNPCWINKIMAATFSPTTQTETHVHANRRILRMPFMLQDNIEFDKCRVPRVVSLGPYHHGDPKLKDIQDLKPAITKMFFKGNQNALKELYGKLLCKIVELRNCYGDDIEELLPKTMIRWGGGIHEVFDCENFIGMLLEDGCFILHCIDTYWDLSQFKENDHQSKVLGLNFHQMHFILQDLFLLENQVPYIVLEELMSFGGSDPLRCHYVIEQFIRNHCFPSSVKKGKISEEIYDRPVHLLQLLHEKLVGKQKPLQRSRFRKLKITNSLYTSRNVNELQTVWIRFVPSKTACLADIRYKSCGFFAYLELPTIMVPRPILLNLFAYEMCSNVPEGSFLVSYMYFLDSLIDSTEDVKELRKAGILDRSLGNDEEVLKLFKELCTELVPDPDTYAEVKERIHMHYYRSTRTKIWVTEFKHEYFKTPWSVLALVGATVALFLGGVQAYFSVWPAPGDCDALCNYLKLNHHL